MNNYSIGSLVKFRGREWVIMPSQDTDLLSLRPLTGSESDSSGIYLPLEKGNIQSATFPVPGINDIGDFESARLLRDAARLLLRYGAGPFRSIGHLSFYPKPYQLVPLLMALRLDPVRMLIADDVGIGKTIESALIARELLDRGEIKRIGVICPPYLCDQWQRELSEKFNISAEIINTRNISKLERRLPRSTLSVFQYYPNIIVSIDFVKSQRRRDAFLIHSPDLIIVDEAHGCSRPPGQSVAQQQRHQLISDLAKSDLTRHIILVTATPHSGIEESFLSLLGFIKPSFERLDLTELKEYQRAELAYHFIQRRRADVKEWMGTETDFPDRDSKEEPYSLSIEYRQLFDNIYRFAKELVRYGESQTIVRRRVRYWTALALLRCVMSSPASAVRALSARIERISESSGSEETDYTPYIFDPTDVENREDIVPTHLVKEGIQSFSESEKRRLQRFIKSAEGLRGDKDKKIKKTEEIVIDLLEDGYSPIIYCRFIQTAKYVAKELKKRLSRRFKDIHLISVTGEDSDEEREIRVAELSDSPERVLVATDCLSEGINLQDSFNAVIHYDLPWNPNRLEQREGRVDRFGQKAKVVKTVLLYGYDNPIDKAVLEVLLRKAKAIHKSLGITVPLPIDSESVMDAVLKRLFFREAETEQLSLFDNKAPVIEVHKRWDKAVERERKSRTRFAQHAIKPDEVAQELETINKVFGDSHAAEAFAQSACQRLGCPLTRTERYWKIDSSRLPEAVQAKLSDNNISKITFNQPADDGVTFVSKNHPLIISLAEQLFNIALKSNGDRNISARCGVIRSKDIETLTVLLLLRLRFLIKNSRNNYHSLAEECMVSGFKRNSDSINWFSYEEAESLFELINPAGNLSSHDKDYWLNFVLKDFDSINKRLNVLAEDKALNLFKSYERLRKSIKGSRVTVQAVLPVDLLSLFVIMPQPEG